MFFASGQNIMTQKDLIALINENTIDRMVFFRNELNGWEIWIYTRIDEFGNEIVNKGNRLRVDRTREIKTYTSIDRAYHAMRGLGYSGSIMIEN
jgi:hypothetical protein